jgi:phosphatidate cytidylyltransferase
MAEATAAKSNLALRLGTAAVWAPFIIWMLYGADAWIFPSVTGAVCVLGAFELFKMLAPAHRALRGYGMVASAGLYAALVIAPMHPFLGPVVVGLTIAGMLAVLAQPHPLEHAAMRMGWAIAGPLYMGALFATIALLYQQPHGGSWVMLALMCGFLSDTGGYFVGRRYGKHKLAPTVSPNKTVEGAFGGLAGGLSGGLLAHFWYLPGLGLLEAIALSLAAAAMGQAGDLCESLIKRSVGVKDSGTVLPGHGGILDRSDAMLFSAATIWGYVVLLR